VVLFPFHTRPHLEAEDLSDNGSQLSKRIKYIYHEWDWSKRLDTYQIKTTISRFSQSWTTRRWGVECEIIYPPASNSFQPGIKKNMILSVGRFTATGHSKKQLEMIAAFGELQESAPSDYEYFSIGGVSDAPKDLEYFQNVSRLARDCRAQVIANIERSRLQQLYEQARVFWHAAGYGEKEEHPELSEHFGLSTVEAMSAGCVPVVINKGGQSEIVEHGISGFLWSTLEELKDYTELLMRNELLRREMAEAARARATLFSRERFLDRFLRLLMRSRTPDMCNDEERNHASLI
jgi:glycosyltransferase involved in cell wall biosynthesis